MLTKHTGNARDLRCRLRPSHGPPCGVAPRDRGCDWSRIRTPIRTRLGLPRACRVPGRDRPLATASSMSSSACAERPFPPPCRAPQSSGFGQGPEPALPTWKAYAICQHLSPPGTRSSAGPPRRLVQRHHLQQSGANEVDVLLQQCFQMGCGQCRQGSHSSANCILQSHNHSGVIFADLLREHCRSVTCQGFEPATRVQTST